MIWTLKHPAATPEILGYLPQQLSEHDPRPAAEQFKTNSPAGWDPTKGFKMLENGLSFPGDPLMPLLAETKLRNEVIRLYYCSWVAIVQPDGSYEISRMD